MFLTRCQGTVPSSRHVVNTVPDLTKNTRRRVTSLVLQSWCKRFIVYKDIVCRNKQSAIQARLFIVLAADAFYVAVKILVN